VVKLRSINLETALKISFLLVALCVIVWLSVVFIQGDVKSEEDRNRVLCFLSSCSVMIMSAISILLDAFAVWRILPLVRSGRWVTALLAGVAAVALGVISFGEFCVGLLGMFGSLGPER